MKQNEHLINEALAADIREIVNAAHAGEESVSYIRSKLRDRGWSNLGNFTKTLDTLTANGVAYEQRGNYHFVKKF
jgi:hypothetical protein